MSLKNTFQLAIDLVTEDLKRYHAAQIDTEKAFGTTEARALQQYLTALSGAYRVSRGEDSLPPDPDLEDLSDEAIEAAIRAKGDDDDTDSP